MQVKRKQYIVDTKFQLRFTFAFVFAALLGTIVSTTFFLFYSVQQLETVQFSVHSTLNSAPRLFTHLFIQANLLSLAFVALLFVLMLLWIRQKMNGSLFRLMSALKNIHNGNLSDKIILRKNDPFTDVADSMDQMRINFRDTFKRLDNDYKEITNGLADLEIDHAKGMCLHENQKKLLKMIETLKKNEFPLLS